MHPKPVRRVDGSTHSSARLPEAPPLQGLPHQASSHRAMRNPFKDMFCLMSARRHRQLVCQVQG